MNEKARACVWRPRLLARGRMHASRRFLAAVSAAILLTHSSARGSEADKSMYNLFQPVPDAQLRDFDTDRPNKTNSPHTLDAGHFQLEMDMLAVALDKQASTHIENWTWANANFRIGLLNGLDLQLLVPLDEQIRQHDVATGEVTKTKGMGDLTVALKANCWGNDGGDTSGGVVVYVKTPTASHTIGNGKTEGNLLFLYQTALPAQVVFGVNAGVGVVVDDTERYQAEPSLSLSVSRTLIGPLSGYFELFGAVPTRQSTDWIGTLDVGLTVMLGKNAQFDTGVNFGLTRAADNQDLFVGLSMRF